ncbi:MAG: phage antirepressor KilAC domain-containing protein [Oscillospiraceae bacterium]|nr:phage antirepressor KilAC domain-containing protein [Oscillospiraceae bacterium]
MNEIQIFTNELFGSVRTLEQNDGKVLFFGSDVAKALGYKRPNDAISTHCRATVKHSIPISGKMQGVNFITEGDMYRLITHSKLPDAEKFESWVFDEILPTIRKHGAYMTEQTIEKALFNPDFLIELATQLKNEQARSKRLETTVAVQEQQIAELQPKASYYDVVLNCKDLISIGKIAKDYGWSARKMNEYLHEHGVQYKQGKTWLLYQKHASYGYTSTKTHIYHGDDGTEHAAEPHMYWTQKGRLFIYSLLKADGIFPLIEQEEKSVVDVA